jgi:transcriptional regulator with PAS, ATPase and Fis domain
VGQSIGRPAAGVSDEAVAALTGYGWPGNVRELRNAIERAVILSEGGMITAEHLPIGIAAAKPAVPIVRISSSQSLGDTERLMIEEALERAGRNKSEAARLLGITRAQLRSRIEKHGLA